MTVPEIELVGSGPDGKADAVDHVADFADFFRLEYPKLVALGVAVTGSRAAAEDAAAEAMSRAYHRWSSVGGYERPGAWTRRVTINLLHSRGRRLTSEMKTRLRLRGRSSSHTTDRAHDIAGEIAGADNFLTLLAPLPPRQRTAAALHYLDDLPLVEIAELMGCSEGTVKSHLHAARTAIARAIEEKSQP